MTLNYKNVFLFVPDGIGVRNYLYSDLIKYLQPAQIGMLHNLPAFVLETVEQLHGVNLHEHRLPKFSESKWQRILREIAAFSRLMRNSRVRKNHRIWKSLLLVKNPTGFEWCYYQLVILAARICSYNIKTIKGIDTLLDNSYGKSKAAKVYKQLLQQTKPDVILCTHQRVPSAAIMALAANQLHIPVVTAIFSWDNLPKSRITLRADAYIVWSSYMKQEMAWYYPEIPQEKVIITGTPQFECYTKTSLYQERVSFANEWSLPAEKQWVLLSGNDMSSPNDQYYFEDIAEAIQEMPEAKRPHLILRRAPVDASGRFDGFADRYKDFVTCIDPLWTKGSADKGWFEILPSYSDVALLTNLCLHCDLVVNIGSTMGLDFAHFNKPAVYINYPKPYNADWYDIEFIYGLEHFRTLDGLDAVLWIKSKSDIVQVIQAGLNTPGAVATQRNEWKRKLTDDIPNASENISNLLLQLAHKHE
ncbi:MAG: hypothetical protein IT252_00980 [Chitinophagaceae bacterium]|nr:hypothetical protein [Chitinophagaceae bacterium]